jgi:hypothetical protein
LIGFGRSGEVDGQKGGVRKKGLGSSDRRDTGKKEKKLEAGKTRRGRAGKA